MCPHCFRDSRNRSFYNIHRCFRCTIVRIAPCSTCGKDQICCFSICQTFHNCGQYFSVQRQCSHKYNFQSGFFRYKLYCLSTFIRFCPFVYICICCNNCYFHIVPPTFICDSHIPLYFNSFVMIMQSYKLYFTHLRMPKNLFHDFPACSHKKKIHIFHFLKYWSKCESFSIIFFRYFIYSALRYNISTSFNVVCLGLAAIFPLFIASTAICGILSSVTPTSERVFGIPRDAFNFLISATSISGLKSFTGSLSSLI